MVKLNFFPFLDADESDPQPEQLAIWLRAGQLDRLEELVLAGKSYLLQNKTSDIEAVMEFLKTLPQYQVTVSYGVEKKKLLKFSIFKDQN